MHDRVGKVLFFLDYLGMRSETVDMTEITRRIEEKINSANGLQLDLNFRFKNHAESKFFSV